MNCRKVSHLLSAYMDGELPGVEHRLIHGHLSQCSECRTEYQMLLQVKRLLAGMRIREPRAEFPHEILHRLTAEQSAASHSSLDSWFRHFTQWWRQIAPPPPIIAFGAGLAAVGMLWTIRMIDLPDGLTWSTTKTVASSPLRTEDVTADSGLVGVSLDSSWARPPLAPVGSSDWNRSLPVGAVPVTFLHTPVPSVRPGLEPLIESSDIHP